MLCRRQLPSKNSCRPLLACSMKQHRLDKTRRKISSWRSANGSSRGARTEISLRADANPVVWGASAVGCLSTATNMNLADSETQGKKASLRVTIKRNDDNVQGTTTAGNAARGGPQEGIQIGFGKMCSEISAVGASILLLGARPMDDLQDRKFSSAHLKVVRKTMLSGV